MYGIFGIIGNYMAFNVCEKPSNSALAIKNKAGGLHGHDDRVRESIHYWRDALEAAAEKVDIARYSLAQNLHNELRGVGWLLDGTALVVDAGGLRYMEQNAERDRKRLLGALAMSDLSRAIFGGGENAVISEVNDGIGTKTANVIFDASGVNGFPLPPRFHIPKKDVVGLLGEGDLETWYQDDTTGLFLRRTGFNLSGPATKILEKDGTAVLNPDSLQTLFPYVPAQAAAPAA